MLRRFADARLRTELARTRDARDQARDTARRLFRRLKATRAALETQTALTGRWKAIAQQAQRQLADERARIDTAEETTR